VISARHSILAYSANSSASAEKAKVSLIKCLPSAVEDNRLWFMSHMSLGLNRPGSLELFRTLSFIQNLLSGISLPPWYTPKGEKIQESPNPLLRGAGGARRVHQTKVS